LGLLAAISRCPVASEATENQRSPLVEAGAACLVQVTPASADVQMSDPTATRFCPLASEAADFQTVLWAGPLGVRSVQVTPESVDVQMSPLTCVAPSPQPSPPTKDSAIRIVPFELEASDTHVWQCAGPEPVRSVQVAPELVDVQMSPAKAPATR